MAGRCKGVRQIRHVQLVGDILRMVQSVAPYSLTLRLALQSPLDLHPVETLCDCISLHHGIVDEELSAVNHQPVFIN